MEKVCIVYASMTGNTEDIKDVIRKRLEEKLAVDTFSMDTVNVNDILDYDTILLGTYTYGDGEIPYEAEDFYDQLEETLLSGKKFACFGSGDSFYEYFCEAALLFEKMVQERGGKLIAPTLKIELSPDDEEKHQLCIDFADEVLKNVENE